VVLPTSFGAGREAGQVGEHDQYAPAACTFRVARPQSVAVGRG
jgi:hypothetical protein